MFAKGTLVHFPLGKSAPNHPLNKAMQWKIHHVEVIFNIETSVCDYWFFHVFPTYFPYFPTIVLWFPIFSSGSQGFLYWATHFSENHGASAARRMDVDAPIDLRKWGKMNDFGVGTGKPPLSKSLSHYIPMIYPIWRPETGTTELPEDSAGKSWILSDQVVCKKQIQWYNWQATVPKTL